VSAKLFDALLLVAGAVFAAEGLAGVADCFAGHTEGFCCGLITPGEPKASCPLAMADAQTNLIVSQGYVLTCYVFCIYKDFCDGLESVSVLIIYFTTCCIITGLFISLKKHCENVSEKEPIFADEGATVRALLKNKNAEKYV
jgi:hypothetical protein